MTKVFTPTDSRARIADWVELQALISPQPSKVTSARLVRAVNIIDDPVRDSDDEDREGDVELDDDLRGGRGILNTVDENLSLRVFEELEFRSNVLGDSYPFDLKVSGQNWSLTRRERPFQTGDGFAHLFYVAALLITAIKYEYVSISEDHELRKAMPELMQVMSVLVAAEYVGGEVYWMGWPRPDETSKFLDALHRFISRISVGRLISSNPAYDPAVVKDGSVDLIAWRSFKDGKPGKTVLYGQVASGKNWRSKPLQATMDPHFVGWFQNGPTRERLLSMFIPFMQHEDCKPKKEQVYDDLLLALAEKDERAMGIIFDRLRITELASQANERLTKLSGSTGIDLAAYIDRIHAWRNELLASVR
jgi:hypothetical protein